MRDKDHLLLEKAYEKVVSEAQNAAYEKLVRDAKKLNPSWDEKNPFTSGTAFQGATTSKEPSVKKEKTPSVSKKKESPKPQKEEDWGLDSEEEIGSFSVKSEPIPEEPTQEVTIPFEKLNSIQSRDPELYTIISGLALDVKQDGDNLKFKYTQDKAENIELFLQKYTY